MVHGGVEVAILMLIGCLAFISFFNCVGRWIGDHLKIMRLSLSKAEEKLNCMRGAWGVRLGDCTYYLPAQTGPKNNRDCADQNHECFYFL
jgi:hypothetical protein